MRDALPFHSPTSLTLTDMKTEDEKHMEEVRAIALFFEGIELVEDVDDIKSMVESVMGVPRDVAFGGKQAVGCTQKYLQAYMDSHDDFTSRFVNELRGYPRRWLIVESLSSMDVNPWWSGDNDPWFQQ